MSCHVQDPKLHISQMNALSVRSYSLYSVTFTYVILGVLYTSTLLWSSYTCGSRYYCMPHHYMFLTNPNKPFSCRTLTEVRTAAEADGSDDTSFNKNTHKANPKHPLEYCQWRPVPRCWIQSANSGNNTNVKHLLTQQKLPGSTCSCSRLTMLAERLVCSLNILCSPVCSAWASFSGVIFTTNFTVVSVWYSL